jgi:hypothetical protein
MNWSVGTAYAGVERTHEELYSPLYRRDPVVPEQPSLEGRKLVDGEAQEHALVSIDAKQNLTDGKSNFFAHVHHVYCGSPSGIAYIDVCYVRVDLVFQF